MATYTVFADVNGAGKTSIYKSVYYERNKNEKRINTDEMVAKIGLSLVLILSKLIYKWNVLKKFKYIPFLF